MCRPIVCNTCTKVTWTGCGMHVEKLQARFPEQQWCVCNPARDARANAIKKNSEINALRALQKVAQKNTSYSSHGIDEVVPQTKSLATAEIFAPLQFPSASVSRL